jgi:hypothetical protein
MQVMRDGRELQPPATLETMGFALERWPTACDDFRDNEKVFSTYYSEIIDLVKKASGAQRVFVFDHTIRETGVSNLNAVGGGPAAAVARVHCDYTARGAPRRLAQLGKDGIYSRLRGRELTSDEVAELSAGRFAFINVPHQPFFCSHHECRLTGVNWCLPFSAISHNNANTPGRSGAQFAMNIR